MGAVNGEFFMPRVLTKRKRVAESLPFKKINYQIIGLGIFLIILGYVALAQEPWDGFLPLVVAPILLVLGYCVVIPFGILYRSREAKGVNSSDSHRPASAG
jgi:hypothetical protein